MNKRKLLGDILEKILSALCSKEFWADTFAMIVFSTVVGLVIEIIISGMTLGQSVQARITAIPLNFITARPYGIFRDWIFKLTRAESGGQIRKGFADILAFVLFQAPLYATVLFFAGASLRQIVTACGTVSVLFVFMGRPYGLFLDFSRWLFRIKKGKRGSSEYKKQVEAEL